jgi:Cys-tRNA(Pro)/Cys-tRNA(Cys) deacylase
MNEGSGKGAHPRIQELLEASKAVVRVHRHADLGVPIRSPDDFARALGYEPGRITKTLLLKAAGGGGFCLAVLPASARADLGVAAARMGAGRCSMASAGELAQMLDYPPMGVSPLGTRGMRVLLDASLAAWPTVLVGAGTVGVEIEIEPEELRRLTAGEWVERGGGG